MPATKSSQVVDPNDLRPPRDRLSSDRLPREQRIRRRAEFLRVQRNGRRVHTKHFLVVVLPHESKDETRRMGVTVTKKVAGAVGRNRTKRLVREVFRQNRELFPNGCAIVIIAKSDAHLLRYEDVRNEMTRIRRPLAAAADKARGRT